MFAFFKTLGISILILTIISFVGVFLIADVLTLSIITMIITYIPNGFIAATTNSKFPYFFAYMTAVTLTLLNFIFLVFIMDFNVFLNNDIIFYSLFTSSILSLVGACIKTNIYRRQMKNA